MTSRDLAARLKVTVETLCRWRARGIGPRYHRFDRSVRYAPQDVDDWLAEQAA
ncbi:helix-turn-helix transcriptional regulator [Rhodococcus sp. AQ5-07]|uniref:helix-turn-helix transcriptional regulator n=1 Tax=Rhodococcus sp. AQ5-07 TaxID=2054902 RepID=UPI000DC050A4|nr:excisionase [Rhodococcus sp. AQ5-07]